MKRRTFTLGVAAGAATLISGCGGGSSGGGKVFLKDVSGMWKVVSQQINSATLTLVQSGSALSGSLMFQGSTTSIALAGTKSGNDIELKGTVPKSTTTITLQETLVSATQMSGQVVLSNGATTQSFIATFAKIS